MQTGRGVKAQGAHCWLTRYAQSRGGSKYAQESRQGAMRVRVHIRWGAMRACSRRASDSFVAQEQAGDCRPACPLHAHGGLDRPASARGCLL